MQKESRLYESQVFIGFCGLCLTYDLPCQCLGILCVKCFHHSDIQYIPVHNFTLSQEDAAQYIDTTVIEKRQD